MRKIIRKEYGKILLKDRELTQHVGHENSCISSSLIGNKQHHGFASLRFKCRWMGVIRSSIS